MKILVILLTSLLVACSTTPSKTSRGSDNNTPMRVTGIGSSFKDARQDGFTQAIQHVVGTIVVNESEAVNSKLVRDDIVEHSSGYVDTYNVVNQTSVNGKIYLVMDVYIKHSQISKRILNKDKETTSVDGTKLSTQYSTYLESRKTLTEVYSNVLRDFPTKAFTVKKVSSQFMLDRNNHARLLVKYRMDWNYNYLVALNEMFQMGEDAQDSSLVQNKIVVISKKPDSWVGKNNRYYFNDDSLYDLVYKNLLRGVIVYGILRDNQGGVVKCEAHHNSLVMGGSYLLVSGSDYIQTDMDISILPEEVNRLENTHIVEFGITTDDNYCNRMLQER